MRESSIFFLNCATAFSILHGIEYVLSINLYVYVMNICMRMCIHVHDAANKIIFTHDIHICMHTCVYIYICIFIHLYIHIYIFIYIYTFIFIIYYILLNYCAVSVLGG